MNRTRDHLRVRVSSGRWGVRRVRVSECHVVLKAEAVYELLLADRQPAVPHARGEGLFTLSTGSSYQVGWEIRANHIWRCGRVFLCCPRCGRRATRLYVPCAGASCECRQCWGLTYASRTLTSYKREGGFLFRFTGVCPSDWAKLTTLERRTERRREALKKYAERRKALRNPSRNAAG